MIGEAQGALGITAFGQSEEVFHLKRRPGPRR
jgi:hypothetical protein